MEKKRGRKCHYPGPYTCPNCGIENLVEGEHDKVREAFITYGLLTRTGTRREEEELRSSRVCHGCYSRLNRLSRALLGAERRQSRAERHSKRPRVTADVPIRDAEAKDGPDDNEVEDDGPASGSSRLFDTHLGRPDRNLAEMRKILIVMLSILTIMQTIYSTL